METTELNRIEVEKDGARWLINGRTYDKISPHEKALFDDFLKEHREK